MQEYTNKTQSLVLENRKKLTLTGVDDVLGFNEETVNVKTNLGDLVVKGSELHIERLDLDTGDVEIEGIIDLLHFSGVKSEKSFFQRIFS